MRPAPLSVFSLLAVLFVSSAGASDTGFDRAMRDEMSKRHIPGMAVLVTRGEKVLKAGYYGFADLEHRVPVSANTSFAIASMSKAFTDAAILLLAEEGRLSIDDPVSKYLNDTPSTWSAMTIRQVMNHTAGLVDDWNHDWDEVPGYFAATQTDEGFLKGLYATPLVFPPGTRMEYGAGPFLAGLIVARVSGQPYETFMRERIFRRLGLGDTYINDPGGVRPGRASGHLWWDEEDAKKPWPWLPQGSPPRGSLTRGLTISPAAQARGDVSVASTAEDMGLWLRGLIGRRLLSPSSSDLMFGSTTLANGDIEDGGFGWFKMPDRGGALLAHGGNFRIGYSSYIAYHQHSGLGIVILTNLASAVDRRFVELIATYFDKDHGPVASRTADPAHAAEMTRIGATLKAISAGRVDEAVMVRRFPLFDYGDGTKDRFGKVTSVASRGCEDVRDWKAAVQGYSTASLCYFEMSGPTPGFGWATISDDGKVSYVAIAPH